jgi:hypothetical protein
MAIWEGAKGQKGQTHKEEKVLDNAREMDVVLLCLDCGFAIWAVIE